MTPSDLTCELSTPELQQRKAGLLATVRAQATALRPVADGLSLEFPDSGATLTDVLELVRLESACCRFLRFELQTGPRGAPTMLQVTGPAGTREFLAGLGWNVGGTA